MANYRRRRPRRKFNLRKIRVSARIDIGALAALGLVVGNLTPTSSNAYRIVSTDLSYSITDLGATQDDGQQFGLAYSDYSAAEVEECVEAQAAVDIGNKVEQEQANRLVRTIGQFQGAPGTGAGKSFNNGNPHKEKLNWYIGEGDRLNVWVRNGSNAAWTTGSKIVIVGNLWVKDGI